MIGGILGLLLVFTLAATASSMSDFSIQLMENVILGLSVSIIIGIVSGIVPALSAARLDPVKQLRKLHYKPQKRFVFYFICITEL